MTLNDKRSLTLTEWQRMASRQIIIICHSVLCKSAHARAQPECHSMPFSFQGIVFDTWENGEYSQRRSWVSFSIPMRAGRALECRVLFSTPSRDYGTPIMCWVLFSIPVRSVGIPLLCWVSFSTPGRSVGVPLLCRVSLSIPVRSVGVPLLCWVSFSIPGRAGGGVKQ